MHPSIPILLTRSTSDALVAPARNDGGRKETPGLRLDDDSPSGGSNTNTQASGTNVGAIVGGVIGALAAIAAILAFLCWRRRKAKRTPSNNERFVVDAAQAALLHPYDADPVEQE